MLGLLYSAPSTAEHVTKVTLVIGLLRKKISSITAKYPVSAAAVKLLRRNRLTFRLHDPHVVGKVSYSGPAIVSLVFFTRSSCSYFHGRSMFGFLSTISLVVGIVKQSLLPISSSPGLYPLLSGVVLYDSRVL